jgi:hypothetical protein
VNAENSAASRVGTPAESKRVMDTKANVSVRRRPRKSRWLLRSGLIPLYMAIGPADGRPKKPATLR